MTAIHARLMRAPGARWIGTVLLAALLAGPAAGQEPTTKKAPEPGFESGKFQAVADAIGRLVRLKITGKGLVLDRDQWTKDFKGKTKAEAAKILQAQLGGGRIFGNDDYAARRAKELLDGPPEALAFERLKRAVGSSSSSSGSYGSSRREKEFTGKGLKAKMVYGGKAFALTLEETAGPQRRIEIADDGWGALRILLTDAAGDCLLVVASGGKGRISVAHVAGDEVAAYSAESFDALYAKHRQYVETRLLPLLKHNGVGIPWTRFHPRVRGAVLAAAAGPTTDADRAAADKFVGQLDADDYKTREAATKTLTADYVRYRDAIARAMKNPKKSPEMASRLMKIVSANPDADEIVAFVAARKLAADAGYLIELLADAQAAADRDVLVKALRRLTKQTIGPDAAAWRAWLAKQKPAKVEK